MTIDTKFDRRSIISCRADGIPRTCQAIGSVRESKHDIAVATCFEREEASLTSKRELHVSVNCSAAVQRSLIRVARFLRYKLFVAVIPFSLPRVTCMLYITALLSSLLVIFIEGVKNIGFDHGAPTLPATVAVNFWASESHRYCRRKRCLTAHHQPGIESL